MGSPGRKQRLPKRDTTRPERSLSFQFRAYLSERGWGDCSKRKEIDLFNHKSLVGQFYPSCFSQFRLLPQNTIDWVASKQLKHISHSSRGWEVHAMVPEDSVSAESLVPDAQKTPHCILPWWKGWGSFLRSVYNRLIHSWGPCHHDLITSQRPHLLKPSPGPLGFQHINLGGGSTSISSYGKF